MRRLITTALAGMAVMAVIFHGGRAAAMDDSAVCGAETARQERQQNIPDRLLHAISLVESGRWDADRRASFAWPWTVMAEGEGRFLPTKAAAIAEVRKLQARGVRNIDVGCMQVNLLAHPDAFASLDEAFDPAANVAYAARFLTGLYESTQNWPTAGAYYHSQTPSQAAPYKARLISTWEQSRRGTDQRLQLASLDLSPQNRPPVGLLLPLPDHGQQQLTAELAEGRRQVAAQAKQKAEALARTQAERVEAKQIADAYRQARIAEYRLRKGQVAGG